MDLVPPQRISASTFYYFDGRLVLVLEVLQDGQAKVKVSALEAKPSFSTSLG